MASEYKTGLMPLLFHWLGLLFCSIFTFIGWVYVLHGNIWLSAFLSLLVVVSLFLIVDRLVVFKIKKNNRPNFLPEFILGGLYVLVLLFSFPLIFHFIDVDFNRKTELQKEGLDKLAAMRNLRNSYDTAVLENVNSFRTTVETELVNYLGARGPERHTYSAQLNSQFPGAIDFKQGGSELEAQVRQLINRETAMRKSKLSIESLYPIYNGYEAEVKPAFEDWQFIKVSYYYRDADSMYVKLLSAAQAKMPGFTFNHTMGTVNLDSAAQSLRNASAMEISIVVLLILAIHCCILVPYIAAARYFVVLKPSKSSYQANQSIKI